MKCCGGEKISRVQVHFTLSQNLTKQFILIDPSSALPHAPLAGISRVQVPEYSLHLDEVLRAEKISRVQVHFTLTVKM
jgi:hypothetical protein